MKGVKIHCFWMIFGALAWSCTKSKVSLQGDRYSQDAQSLKGLDSAMEKPLVTSSAPVAKDYFIKDVNEMIFENSEVNSILPEKEWDLLLAPIVQNYMIDRTQHSRPIEVRELSRLRKVVFVDHFSEESASHTMAICIKSRYKYFESKSTKSKVIRDHYYIIEVLRSKAYELIPDVEEYDYFNSDIPSELVSEDPSRLSQTDEKSKRVIVGEELLKQRERDRFNRRKNDLLTVKWALYHQLTHCLLGRGHSDLEQEIMTESFPSEGFDYLPVWKSSLKKLLSK